MIGSTSESYSESIGSLPDVSPKKIDGNGSLGAHIVRQLPEKSNEAAKVVSVSHEHRADEAPVLRENFEKHHLERKDSRQIDEQRVEDARLSVVGVEPSCEGQKITDAALLKAWMPVKEIFDHAVSELRESACIPDGSAAYVRLILPLEVERVLGRLEFRAGSTGYHGKGAEIGENTLANIGSSGKPITCIGAAILEHQGFLRFEDTICRYFPKEVMQKFRHDCFGSIVDPSKITIEMLANMTAGLAYTGLMGVATSTPEERAALSYDALLRKPEEHPSILFTSRPEDAMCSYSNLQLQLLSYAIEKAYKEKALKELIERRPELGNAPLPFFSEYQSNSIKQFLDIVLDKKRETAYIDGVYIYDVIDQILEKEAPLEAHCSFETILQKELFQPLDIHEATYEPSGDVVAEERVLAMPAMGSFPPPDHSRNGAGTLYMTPADETKLIRALMKSKLVGADGLLVGEKRMTDLFSTEGKSCNMPSWSVGGVHIEETPISFSIGKGGELDQYKHFFKWERMKDPQRQEEAVGFFAWNNFNCTREDFFFGMCVGRMYEEVKNQLGMTRLRSEEKETQQVSIIPESPAILSGGRNLVPTADLFFKGDLGLMAYKPNEFLYWAGVAYRIQVTDDKEYVFIDGEHPESIKIFTSADGSMQYIQVGGAQAAQVTKSSVLEAQSTPKNQKDLSEVYRLLPELQGVYHGDHTPASDIAFVQNEDSEWVFLPPPEAKLPGVSLQFIAVQRDDSEEIKELHMTWRDKEGPPDKMVKFVRGKEGVWQVQIANFLTEAKYETCTKQS